MYLLTSGESLASASSCVAFSVESAADCNDFSCSTCVRDFSPSCLASVRQVTSYPPSTVQQQRISPPHSAQTYSVGRRYGKWPSNLPWRLSFTALRSRPSTRVRMQLSWLSLDLACRSCNFASPRQ